jgi:hypothetical protein
MGAIAMSRKVVFRTDQASRNAPMVRTYWVHDGIAAHANNFPGLLIYIPGFSEEGILLALAGGSNETFVSRYEI